MRGEDSSTCLLELGGSNSALPSMRWRQRIAMPTAIKPAANMNSTMPVEPIGALVAARESTPVMMPTAHARMARPRCGSHGSSTRGTDKACQRLTSARRREDCGSLDQAVRAPTMRLPRRIVQGTTRCCASMEADPGGVRSPSTLWSSVHHDQAPRSTSQGTRFLASTTQQNPDTQTPKTNPTQVLHAHKSTTSKLSVCVAHSGRQ